jgi:hypothetical protein
VKYLCDILGKSSAETEIRGNEGFDKHVMEENYLLGRVAGFVLDVAETSSAFCHGKEV